MYRAPDWEHIRAKYCRLKMREHFILQCQRSDKWMKFYPTIPTKVYPSVAAGIGGWFPCSHTKRTLWTISLKKSCDQTSSEAGSLTKGRTSLFACSVSSCAIACDISFRKDSTSRGASYSQCPLWRIRFSRCAKCNWGWFAQYQTKSYQSRPFTLFFHFRHNRACIFPANRSGNT